MPICLNSMNNRAELWPPKNNEIIWQTGASNFIYIFTAFLIQNHPRSFTRLTQYNTIKNLHKPNWKWCYNHQRSYDQCDRSFFHNVILVQSTNNLWMSACNSANANPIVIKEQRTARRWFRWYFDYTGINFTSSNYFKYICISTF